jgi:hypothetical protein
MRGTGWLLLAALAFPAAADTNPVSPEAEEESPLGLASVRLPDLELVYQDPILTYLVPHAARTFLNSLAWQRRIFGWEPYDRTTVMLKDFSDYGNAGATPIPRNTVRFDIAPMSRAFETNPSSERMYSTMNHELVHLATTDMATAEDRRWRRFFRGKLYAQPQHPETLLYSYLTVPRFTVPRWYLEGSAVFMETWMGGGFGRAQGGYDEMVFRAMVRDAAPFHDPLALVSRGTRTDFQVGANAYLYGTRFFTYLAHAHSPEKVVAWLKRDEGSKRGYADQFEHVFGRTLEQGWDEWIAFERGFQERNLAEVRKHPVTPHRNLVPTAVGSSSRTHYDEATGILYGAFRYPGVVEHVGALDTRDGSLKVLADVKGAMLYSVTSFAYDPATRTAFYTADNLAFRDLMALDVASGRETMLLEDARVGEIVFNAKDKSLLGIRHQNGLATLVRIPHPYKEWNQVYTFPYGVVPAELDISPDGRLLSASVSEVTGDEFLRVWPLEALMKGDAKPLSEHSFGQSVPEGFVFSRDGRFLYGSSYFTGISNIFRYEVATGAVEAVSNAESGFFRPVPLADGRLVVLNFTGQGFVPAMIEPRVVKDVSAIRFLGAELAARHPVVTTWGVPPPSGVDYEKQVTGSGVYRPLRRLELQSAFPVLQGYKDSAGIGYHVDIGDPLGFAAIGITAAITPDSALSKDEYAHAEVTGRYQNWHGRLSWNRSDFYDLFGPTKRSRKGYAVVGGYSDFLIYDEPRKLELKTELAYYGKLDTLPDFQNVRAPVERLASAEAGLHYTFVRRSLGAVDDEKGLAWSAVASAEHANGETIPKFWAGLDFGLPLPFNHASIWSRSAVGAANGDRDDPLANFFFGGFKNNYVDSGRAIQRYRQYLSFPGFDIDEIGGRSFARQMVEVNLPPIVFANVGTPALHATWLRASVFGAALWTEPQDSGLRQRYNSVGAQADLRFSVLHWYDMTLSFGYAVGYRGSKRAGDEWMVSLKVM